jgi:hypothetical protein
LSIGPRYGPALPIGSVGRTFTGRLAGINTDQSPGATTIFLR